ncbi:MAG: hypothetical protein IJW03_02075 [Clostridia bacterium]|nr:hypothetical protein [Clostridia bacterium]
MINELSAKAKSSNNNAKVAFYVTFIAAVVIFGVSFILPRFSGLVGNVGLIMIVAAVLIYSKYVSPEYYYDVTHDSAGSAVFVVRMITGKRQSTFCRIGLAEIVKIERESAEERKKHKTPRDTKKYSYCPTLMPSITYRIYTRSRYEKAEIIIEVSDEFASLLERYAAEARLIEADEE